MNTLDSLPVGFAVQDPTLLDRHNIVAFDHVKRDLKLMSDEEKAAQEVWLHSRIPVDHMRCRRPPRAHASRGLWPADSLPDNAA